MIHWAWYGTERSSRVGLGEEMQGKEIFPGFEGPAE